MKKKLVVLLMGTGLILAACGGGSDKTSGDSAGAGDPEKLFGQKCASCHGTDLKGSGNFPDLTKIGSKLDQAGIEKIINEGGATMPKAQLTGEDVPTVAKWLSEKK
jgi:cytochrome c551